MAVLMVQGTASSAGKSTLVAGLCRLFARRGIRVAPFKAQNMSNNAAVCAGGGEIGRAQFAQAIAAGIEPTVDMNPILLKPQPGGTQVIVRGQIYGRSSAAEYFGGQTIDLWPVVTQSLHRLRSEYELVIAEGAGSPAEINLRDRDIVNMRVALHAQADVLLVADIDRGGAFAALLGTWQWLAPDERKLVRGFVLNKFRGDPALLAPAPQLLRQRTGVPIIGVVPFLEDLALPDEDAASLTQRTTSKTWLEIAIVKLPHIANFDEFTSLAHEPGVHVRWVAQPYQLRAPDLVIVPGSKSTVPDLVWLRERGLAARIRWLAAQGTPVLGVCAGYQMLGSAVRDPVQIESAQTRADGLGLLPVDTTLGESKRLTRVRGSGRRIPAGFWACLSGVTVDGYEIHMGQTSPNAHPFLELEGVPDGGVSPDGIVAGTYVHGLLEGSAARRAVLQALAQKGGFTWTAARDCDEDHYDRLASVLEEALCLDTLPGLVRPSRGN